jgi:hypothetical protein
MVVEIGMGIIIILAMVTVAVHVDESWRWTVEVVKRVKS